MLGSGSMPTRTSGHLGSDNEFTGPTPDDEFGDSGGRLIDHLAPNDGSNSHRAGPYGSGSYSTTVSQPVLSNLKGSYVFIPEVCEHDSVSNEHDSIER